MLALREGLTAETVADEGGYSVRRGDVTTFQDAHNTGIYKSMVSEEPCDVCGEEGNEVVNISGALSLIQLCPDCAKLAGKIGEEIEPSGGGV